MFKNLITIGSKIIINRSLVIGIFLTILIMSTNVFSATYYYSSKEKLKTNESSISTVAKTPTFDFKSQSQYLIEPYSGKVLYAHNEDEKLLPASVTKVMTILLVMEQIDSRKTCIYR